MTSAVLEATQSLVEKDAFGIVISVIAGQEAGSKAVLDDSGEIIAGSLPHRVAESARVDALALMSRETSSTLAYGEDELFFEVIAPRPRL
ncbi:MAG TPA: hypothetical protein VHM29_11245, partial [Acidimicrobiia bacterium]|nr:hypothetical protein [Acidimicrobiia bacterium]